MDKSSFEPLYDALEKYFDKPFEELPTELQQRVKDEFIGKWDLWTPADRRSQATWSDCQNDPDPENQKLMQQGFDFEIRLQWLQEELIGMELQKPPHDKQTELKLWEERQKRYVQERAEIQEKLRSIIRSEQNELPMKVNKSVGSQLNSIRDWVLRARNLADECRKKNSRLSQLKIAEKIAPVLEKDGYLNQNGHPFKAETIKKQALSGYLSRRK